jgi:ABC-type transport system involved in Fe-S cluster assembly, permease component
MKIMNKIVISNDDDIFDYFVTEDTYIRIDLKDESKIINIDVMEHQNLKVFETCTATSNKVTYNIHSGAQLIVNKIAIDNSDSITVNLIGYGASVTYNSSIINYCDNVYVQNIIHKSDNTKSRVVNHGINVNDRSLHIIVNGDINKECKECSSNQDNKIINMKNGKSFISPNLIVDNNLVDAFHSAYIGSFDEESVFYLKSRGLTEKVCNELLIKGFMLGTMELDENELEVFLKQIENI